MGLKRRAKKLLIWPLRLVQKRCKTTTKDDTWGFPPATFNISVTRGTHGLNQHVRELQYNTAIHSAKVNIQDGKRSEKEHYDYWGYPVHTPNFSYIGDYKETLTAFYAALGSLPLCELAIQDPKSPTALVEVLRLRDLTICLRGLRETLKSLSLSGIILVGTKVEVNEYSIVLESMKELRLLEINRCRLLTENKEGWDSKVGWSSILRSGLKARTLEALHLSGDFYRIPTLVLYRLKHESGDKLRHDSAPSSCLPGLLGSLQAFPANLKDLSLCYVWNKANAQTLISFLWQYAKNMETLNLSLKVTGVHLNLSSLLQTLAASSKMKHLLLHASEANGGVVENVDDQTWKDLWEKNFTLEVLNVTPQPPLTIQAQTDLWLTLNEAGYKRPHRLDDANPAVWTHVLAFPGIYNDLDAIYDILSSVHPVLIPMKA